jgi:hypothetical protein
MNIEAVKDENIDSIVARLRFAQSLLEESDQLEGRSGYNLGSDNPQFFHQRHEREALVTYLLLTCFDRLGQERGFTTLSDWLKSKKAQHIAERDAALDSLPTNSTHLEASCVLADKYQALYGVRNAFCQGINNLPEEVRKCLFASVKLSFIPEYGTQTSWPDYPLEDAKLEQELKLKYLYEKRNRFTHRLEQYHNSSVPSMSDHWIPNGSASWWAMIKDNKLTYLGAHTDQVPLKTGGAYVYTFVDWPFVLFEVLHQAIRLPFERTSIQLKFSVLFFSSARPMIVGTSGVIEHCLLKDFRSLARDFWAEPDERERYH